MNIDIPIGQKIFSIECDSASSSSIKTLGADLNKRVNAVLSAVSGIDNQTAIVFASILALGEISDLKIKLKEQKNSENFENDGSKVDIIDSLSSTQESSAEEDDLFDNESVTIKKYIVTGLLAKITEIEEKIKAVK